MYIGAAARLSGTSIKTIRHYEAIGLLPEPPRQGKYRLYSQQSLEQLSVIRCARQLGFRLKEMQGLFQGHTAGTFPWAEVQAAIAAKHAELAARIAALQHQQAELVAFAKQFDPARDDCPL